MNQLRMVLVVWLFVVGHYVASHASTCTHTLRTERPGHVRVLFESEYVTERWSYDEGGNLSGPI